MYVPNTIAVGFNFQTFADPKEVLAYRKKPKESLDGMTLAGRRFSYPSFFISIYSSPSTVHTIKKSIICSPLWIKAFEEGL